MVTDYGISRVLPSLHHGRDCHFEVQGYLPCRPRARPQDAEARPRDSFRQGNRGRRTARGTANRKAVAGRHGWNRSSDRRHRFSRKRRGWLGSAALVKLLLDTHIWIWSQLEPHKIGSRIAKILEHPATEKWLSPISLWEFTVLVEKGRLNLTMKAEEWIAKALEQFPVTEAPLTWEVMLAIPSVRLPHRDPADAFLGATAKVFDLVLVTADARLLSSKGFSVLANS